MKEFRTLFLSLPLIYAQLENKKQKKEGHEMPEKTLLTDAEIEKQASDYLLARFALSDGEVPIPAHAMPGFHTSPSGAAEGNEGPKQRQILLNKNFGDNYETLEIAKPEKCNTEKIAKWTVPVAEAELPGDSDTGVGEAAEGAAGAAEHGTSDADSVAAAAAAAAAPEAVAAKTNAAAATATTASTVGKVDVTTAADGDTKAAYKNLASGIAAKATVGTTADKGAGAKRGGREQRGAATTARNKKGAANTSPPKGGRAKRVQKVNPRG
jgi:hypothetical protein